MLLDVTELMSMSPARHTYSILDMQRDWYQ